MSKLFDLIYEVQPRILFLVFVPLGVLGYYFPSWIYWGGLLIVLFVIAGIRFFRDKKWLKDADMYVRINRKDSKRKIWWTILNIMLYIGSMMVLIYYPDYVKVKIPEFALSILAPIVILNYADYFVKFVNSIKSFEKGIQLPGRNCELILWSDIQQFEMNQTVYILTDLGEVEYPIDPRDKSYMLAIISKWKQKNEATD